MTTIISALYGAALVLVCLLIVVIVTLSGVGLFEYFSARSKRGKRLDALPEDFEAHRARVEARLAAHGKQTSGIIVQSQQVLSDKEIAPVSDKIGKQMQVRRAMRGGDDRL